MYISNASADPVPLIPPLAHSPRQVAEHADRRVPIDASVRDADALLQARQTALGHLLAPGAEVRLEHHADDSPFARAQLVGDGVGDQGLVVVVFAGVAWEGSVSGGIAAAFSGRGVGLDSAAGKMCYWVGLPCEQSIMTTSLWPCFRSASFAILTLAAS